MSISLFFDQNFSNLWPLTRKSGRAKPATPDAYTVLEQLAAWFADYNAMHPHSALRFRSPNEFRDDKLSPYPCPGSWGQLHQPPSHAEPGPGRSERPLERGRRVLAPRLHDFLGGHLIQASIPIKHGGRFASDLGAFKHFPRFATFVNTMHLKHTFCQIDPNSRDVHQSPTRLNG
jgi:hypothetical protein